MRKEVKRIIKIVASIIVAFSLLCTHRYNITAAEGVECTSSDSILITKADTSYVVKVIDSTSFSGDVEWEYAKYNTSGIIIESGTVSDTINLSYDEYIVAAPVSGSGTFNDSTVNAVLRENIPLYKQIDMSDSTMYTVTNSSEYSVYMEYNGTTTLEYMTGELWKTLSPNSDMLTIESGKSIKLIRDTADGYVRLYCLSGNDIGISSEVAVCGNLELDMYEKHYSIKNTGSGTVYFKNVETVNMSEYPYYQVYDKDDNIVASSSGLLLGELAQGNYMRIQDPDTNENAGEKINISYIYDGVNDIDVTTYRNQKQTSVMVNYHYYEQELSFSSMMEGGYTYNTLLSEETEISEPEDVYGSFLVREQKDSKGRAYANKWYVYDSRTGDYYKETEVVAQSFELRDEPQFYNKLMELYEDTGEIHIFFECVTAPITKSDNYELVKDVQYTLGEGMWKVEGDNCKYSGNSVFYIDGTSGNYELTLQ